MKSEIAKKLKEILDQIPQEQFDKEWAEIEDLGMEGPSFDQVIESFLMVQSAGSFELKLGHNQDVSDIVSMTLAA